MKWLAVIGSLFLVPEHASAHAQGAALAQARTPTQTQTQTQNQDQAKAEKPALLILGLPHFQTTTGNVINYRMPDVLTPDRQREIDAVVEKLASFRPTQVAVEFPMEKQDLLDRRYAEYRAGRYKLTANETDQIGLRLAARLNLPRVHAIDWGEEPPGGWSHYNYPGFANANGRGDEWQAWVAQGEQKANEQVRLMACTPVSAWARRMNSPEYRRQDHQGYYYIAQIGDRAGANPGAAWVGSWYTRNLRILNNLRAIAPDAGDRVVAVYGAGHGYLLDRLARESGDFTVADTLAHLPRSGRDGWTRCPN